MSIPEILALLVVLVAVPLSWLVAIRLWALVRFSPSTGTKSGKAFVRSHAIIALCLAMVVSVFGLIFINNGMASPVFDTWATQIITRTTLLVLSVVPAVYWLKLYREL